MKDIEIGQRYVFNYPSEFTGYPDHTAHAGQSVLVLEEIVGAGDDQEFPEKMFRVQAEDGWIGEAWQGELS